MPLNVVMLGPPGAGKGTQAERLARRHGVPRISTGDMLRDAVRAGTELGRRAEAVMTRGELVSDELIIEIVRERLDQEDARGGFVLDGFPRTVAQAEALDALTGARGPLIVVEIDVPEAELVRRLQGRRVCSRCGANAPVGGSSASCPRCGGPLVRRSDDTEDAIRERLRVYARDTKPLVDFYRARRTFVAINGAQPPDQVAREVADAVAARLAPATFDTAGKATS